MSTIQDVRKAIYERFTAEWVVGLNPRTPYYFDDEIFDPPNAPWAKLIVRTSNGFQDTLGRAKNRKFARTGQAIVLLRKPPLVGGAKAMDALVMPALDLFQGRRLLPTNAWFKDVVPNDIGKPDKGRWYEATVIADFEFTEII